MNDYNKSDIKKTRFQDRRHNRVEIEKFRLNSNRNIYRNRKSIMKSYNRSDCYSNRKKNS